MALAVKSSHYCLQHEDEEEALALALARLCQPQHLENGQYVGWDERRVLFHNQTGVWLRLEGRLTHGRKEDVTTGQCTLSSFTCAFIYSSSYSTTVYHTSFIRTCISLFVRG